MVESLKSVFMGLKPEIRDWSEPGTPELAKSANITHLPALLLDKSAQKDEAGYKHMERWLTPAGEYFSIKIKADFDPTAEICDDGIDNTGNGKVDCDDETCLNTLTCRPETAKTLELFVMSQCPFGSMALNAMNEVLDAFKGDMTFNLNYIGNVVGDTITSMKGPAEVDENIRWACANKHYPRNNDYLKFIWCRAADSRNPEWQKCATGPIKAAVIEKCFNEEGKDLLKENLKIANSLGVSACPTWIANGKQQFSGITARAIQENFCKANPDLKGCATPLSDDRKNAPPAGSCGG
jgi:hypothetical protein